jgi:hypothetical protein
MLTVQSSSTVATIRFRSQGIKNNLPENILLALIGGVSGLFGIDLVHIEKDLVNSQQTYLGV